MTANAKSTLWRRLVGLIAGLAGLGSGAGALAEEAGSLWAAIPSPSEMIAAYPQALTAPGSAVMVCTVADGGTLKDCVVDHEDAPGIGAAALSLVPKFRANTTMANGSPSAGVRVKIPMKFAAPLRQVRFPKSDPRYEGGRLGLVGPYYPARAADLRINGAVVIACAVGLRGELRRCKIVEERPAREDFGAAAMRMSGSGWIVAEPLADGSPENPDALQNFVVLFRVANARGSSRR